MSSRITHTDLAINLVNSSSTYTYDMRTQVYSQPVFAHQTLLRLLGTNASILNALQTKNDIELERRAPLPAGTSLAELISVGTKDLSLAPTVLQAVLAELGSQDKLALSHRCYSPAYGGNCPGTPFFWLSTTSRRSTAPARTGILSSRGSSPGICPCLACSSSTLVARSLS
jgi:hypothetical protein